MIRKSWITAGLIAGAGVLFIAANALYTVSQVHQALVVQFGRPVAIVREPGLKVKTPFVQDVVYFDKRLLEFNAEPKEIIAADQKRLIVDAFVRYRITDPLEFYQAVRDEARMVRVLDPIVDSSLRKVLGSVPLQTILSDKRAGLMEAIKREVNAKTSGDGTQPSQETPTGEAGKSVEQSKEGASARGYRGLGIEVVDVRIMRADFPEGNSQKIYQRMQAGYERQSKDARAKGEEEAQRIRANADRERVIILANAENEAQVSRGQGDGEAARIFAEASGRDPEFFRFYRSMQAYRKILAKENTSIVLSPQSDLLHYLESLEPR